MNVITIMKILFIAGMVFIGFMLFSAWRKQRSTEEGRKQIEEQKKHRNYNNVVALVSNFFDTLGIGSYAIASSAYKIRGSVDDVNIPGTLNAGDCIPVLLEAFLFVGFVQVDTITLITMIVAQVLGANIGAGIVIKWDAHKIRMGMGFGLFALGIIMAVRQMGWGPFGITGNALGLTGAKLVGAVIVSFVLGMLMNIGIGAYAPMFALVSTLGMNVQAAFPIMMGGCSLLMAYGNAPKFIRKNKIDLVATLANTIFGSAGVLIAYFLVKSLPLTILMWLVIVVVMYTAVMFLHDAFKKSGKKEK